MFKLFAKPKIYQATHLTINESQIHGKGVFAGMNFKTGDIVEIAPVILLDKTERELLQYTSLYAYYYLIAGNNAAVAVGLGYSSLYNHAGRANAVYSISIKEKSIQIKACKKIRIGEEITLNYNGLPDDETPVYFLKIST